MSDKDSEATKGTEGAQPEGSDKGAGQPSSEQEFVTVAQFNQIQERLDTLARIAQGDKDRAVKKTNQRLDGIEQILQNAVKEGKSLQDLLDDTNRQAEEEFRSTVKELATLLKGVSPEAKAQGSAQAEGVNISDVLNELELDISDARVKDFASKRYASKEQAYLEGAKLVKKILSTQPTDADLPSGTNNVRAQNASKQEQLMREYAEGSKTLTGQRLINFKMEMRKKGLRIS